MSLNISNTIRSGRESQGSDTRYRFRITVEGFMLLLVMVLVGFAAWHSGTNLLYLIFAVLVSFYLAHGALLWLNLSRLTVGETLPDTVVVNQPFEVTVKVDNGKRFLSTWALTVTHFAPPAGRRRRPMAIGSVYISQVPAAHASTAVYTTALGQRGYHDLESAAVATRYPFSFEERTQIRRIQKRVLALPAMYNVASLAAALAAGFGDQESMERGAGTDLFGLREYAPGDHARSIHWRTSARAQKLIVSEYSRDERRQATLFLDNGVQSEKRTATMPEFENAITLTASLARHLIQNGFEVGLLTSDGDIPPAQGSAQLLWILQKLATLDMTDPSPIVHSHDNPIYVQFQSGALNQPPADARTIDSRAWRPPADAYGKSGLAL